MFHYYDKKGPLIFSFAAANKKIIRNANLAFLAIIIPIKAYYFKQINFAGSPEQLKSQSTYDLLSSTSVSKKVSKQNDESTE